MAAKKIKPKLLIGSSSEAKNRAEAFCTALNQDANAVPWWHSPEFRSGFSTMEALVDAVDVYDFGVHHDSRRQDGKPRRERMVGA
jgi:predicted nucleotide-binding protein